jgi:hypothetical protein
LARAVIACAALIRRMRPRGMAGLIVPALVSSSDPTDVEVLCDELPSMNRQSA